MLPLVLPLPGLTSRRRNRSARFMALRPRRVEPIQQGIEIMPNKGWTPRRKTTRVARGRGAQLGGTLKNANQVIGSTRSMAMPARVDASAVAKAGQRVVARKTVAVANGFGDARCLGQVCQARG